jgi:pimeloyl-ACP methyl ester carboxylesterase
MTYWVWGAGVLAGVLALIAMAGAVYQIAGERADLGRHPPPGRLVEVGGRRLHVYCAGTTNDPTVIIEAGSGNDSTLWGGIVVQVASFARVCTYDRAGLGWSDPASTPMTLDDRANDLHAMLSGAGVSGPLILVGHSYGGYVVRAFARSKPDRVVGVVLVDAPDEGYSFDLWGLRHAREIRVRERRIGWAARFGLLRFCVTQFPARFDPVKGVPPDVRGEMTALYLRSSRHFAMADEMASYEAVPHAMRGPGGLGLLGDLPLIVVSRGSRDRATGCPTQPEWLAAQDRLLALSTRSVHVVAEESGHMIQFGQPSAIINAIRRLWDVCRDDQG